MPAQFGNRSQQGPLGTTLIAEDTYNSNQSTVAILSRFNLPLSALSQPSLPSQISFPQYLPFVSSKMLQSYFAKFKSLSTITVFLVFLSFILLPSFVVSSPSSPLPSLRVCLIGSGISSASSVQFLHESLHRQYDVRYHVFEREARIGGRVADMELTSPGDSRSSRFENGASILHDSNAYLKHFAKDLLNLTIQSPPKPKLGASMGIWDGEEFRLELTGSWWHDPYTVLKRYGLDFHRMSRAIEDVAEKFVSVYPFQERGVSFASPKELLQAMRLYNLTQQSFQSWMEPYLKDPLVMDELGAASTRVNYNQGLTLNAMAGAVGLIPMTNNNLWNVAEGNARIIEGLFRLRNAQVKLKHVVQSIEGQRQSAQVLVKGVDGYGVKFTESCDTVILAAPLELANIDFRMPNTAEPKPGEKYEEFFPQPLAKKKTIRKYQTTHTTWVQGKLKSEPFSKNAKIERKEPLPFMILTTEQDATPFTSISAYKEDPVTGMRTYKIFSRAEFNDDLIRQYFDKVDLKAVRRTPWQAYPLYQVPEDFFPSFQMFPPFQVYYPLAFEPSASCMEVEAVAAKNTALQIAEVWKEKRRTNQGLRFDPPEKKQQHDEL